MGPNKTTAETINLTNEQRKSIEAAIRRSWNYIADEVVMSMGTLSGEDARLMALDRVTMFGGLSSELNATFHRLSYSQKMDLATSAMPQTRWVY